MPALPLHLGAELEAARRQGAEIAEQTLYLDKRASEVVTRLPDETSLVRCDRLVPFGVHCVPKDAIDAFAARTLFQHREYAGLVAQLPYLDRAGNLRLVHPTFEELSPWETSNLDEKAIRYAAALGAARAWTEIASREGWR